VYIYIHTYTGGFNILDLALGIKKQFNPNPNHIQQQNFSSNQVNNNNQYNNRYPNAQGIQIYVFMYMYKYLNRYISENILRSICVYRYV
jgi:hypothetical protein